MPTIIAYHPTGFEVRFEVELRGISDMLLKLEKRRYRPSREVMKTPDGLPICPRHGVPMRERNKQNDTWYSHKVVDPATGTPHYCRGYPGASSPGYEIDPTPPSPRRPTPPATAGRGLDWNRAEVGGQEGEPPVSQVRSEPRTSVKRDTYNDGLFS